MRSQIYDGISGNKITRARGHFRAYTQFAIQDSRLFGPNPWKILAPPSNYLSKKSFWATQPLEQILDSEFLLCEPGVPEQSPHTWHILPPSEIDLGLCLAVFAGSEGRYLFHRIG